jgi:hypothetical protein
LNRYQVLPAINTQSFSQQPVGSSNSSESVHINNTINANTHDVHSTLFPNSATIIDNNNEDIYLPVEPVELSVEETQSLIENISKDLSNYSSSQLKNLYNEMTTYDPKLSGYAHYTYVSLVAMRNHVIIKGFSLKIKIHN